MNPMRYKGSGAFTALIRKRILFILATLSFGLIIPLFACQGCLSSTRLYLIISGYSVSIWVSMWFGNEFLSIYLNRKIAWTRQPVKRFVVGIVAMIIYTVSVTLLLVWAVRFFFGISMGNIGTMLYTTVMITFVITLFMTSRSFLFNWRQVAINAETHRRESISARYENLKSQVNPHFLFNSLNALTNLVQEDPDKAIKFIKQLADVYRYVLDTRGSEVVPLTEELQFLAAYAYLQQIRFGERLQIDIRLNGLESMVAPLSLQLLVENAIKHNVISESSPLQIRLYADEDYIVIENNINRKVSPSGGTPGLGLENIRKRYTFLSERETVVKEDSGRFVVKLPLIRNLKIG